ncbi:MAG: metallophosphoesterase family protein [Chthoniobacteraceae bacterium]
MRAKTLFTAAVFAVCASLVAFAADETKRGPDGGKRGPDAPVDDARFLFRTEVPAQAVDVILGRPTKHSVTVSVLAYADREGAIQYGPKAGALSAKTAAFALKAGEPAEVAITGLQSDTQYFYRLSTRVGNGAWAGEPERSFRTQRAPGSSFIFTVQADPHLDFGTDKEVYRKSLANALAAKTDFHIDLGDTFMTDKYPSFKLSAPQYLAQRYYFSIVGHSAPVFLVLGNHDGETIGKGRGGDGESMPVWSNTMRKRYFPNPVPNDFYSGNTTVHPEAGLLENYYAWEWGDALFIALDQYWYSQKQRGSSGDNWSRTLGAEQFAWLKRTLETSKAKFKFVFIHHLVGGETPEGRGGSEASHFFEWGGKELDGRNTFAEKRPGWSAPIHDLLVKHGGSIVFHGHDHLYVQQERDGIIYQLVPQPGHSRFDNTRSTEEYGYKSGVKRGASGILRVTVSPDKAVADYVRAYPDSAESAERKTGAVTHSYTIKPR